MNAIKSIVSWLAGRPALFDSLRWVLEGGFVQHRQIIKSHLSSTGRDVAWKVLDIGCGTGLYAAHFPANQYVGIDISPVYTNAARSKFPEHRFETGDARQLTFKGDDFDAAFISGVIHHLTDDDAVAVLKEAIRVIKPSGRLVVWEDIPAPWWNIVGHVAHRLDLGACIRAADGYRKLIEHALSDDSERPATQPSLHVYTVRSGFMDYAVFVCDFSAGPAEDQSD
ncbi:MAG: class I SAM-dependent methyltransferase [Planctomycetaceae bacterium]|nr:class I SAM-dependent methyltransferase [Planctomycetaceae bacterium]